MPKTKSHNRNWWWFDKLGSEEATALIELALVTPIFIILLLGAAELGRLTYIGIEVANAARAGVQYGAQSHATAADILGMKTAATTDGPDVTTLTGTALVPTASNFCKCSDGSASTCLNTDCSTSRIIEYVQVNTSAAVSPLFIYPGIPGTITLKGIAVMRVAQ